MTYYSLFTWQLYTERFLDRLLQRESCRQSTQYVSLSLSLSLTPPPPPPHTHLPAYLHNFSSVESLPTTLSSYIYSNPVRTFPPVHDTHLLNVPTNLLCLTTRCADKDTSSPLNWRLVSTGGRRWLLTRNSPPRTTHSSYTLTTFPGITVSFFVLFCFVFCLCLFGRGLAR